MPQEKRFHSLERTPQDHSRRKFRVSGIELGNDGEERQVLIALAHAPSLPHPVAYSVDIPFSYRPNGQLDVMGP
jgi:hypothetical protein